MTNLGGDLKAGFRAIVRGRSTFAPLVLLLAVGLSAATTIFTIADGIYLRSLPFREAHRLVVIWQSDPTQPYSSRTPVSAPDFRDWQASARSFEGLAAVTIPKGMTLMAGGDPQRVSVAGVTPDTLALLGANPVIGRSFQSENEASLVVSHRLWQTVLDGRADVVGRPVTLDGRPYEVVGVLPPRFALGLYEVEAIVPLARQLSTPESRTVRALCVLGRLAPDASLVSAQREMTAVARRLSALHPATNQHVGAEVVSIQENALGYLRAFFLWLAAGAVLLLAIACLNAARLTSSHFLERSVDVAIRLSLGATMRDIARSVLAEGLLVGLLAASIAWGLASAGVSLFVAYAPAGLPRADEVHLGLRSLALLAALGITTTTIAALVPLFRFRGDTGQHLRDAGRTVVSPRHDRRLHGALTVIEVALTLVLLVGAALVVSSLVRVTRTAPGFNPTNLLTFRLTRPVQAAADVDPQEFYRRAFGALRSASGLSGIAGVNNLPFTATADIHRVGAGGGEPQNASAAVVTPGYFETVGIPLAAGRDFAEHDGAGGVAVAIVNTTLAQRLFRGSPIGATLQVATSNDPARTPIVATVVGVVGDIKQWNLLDQPDNQVYYPFGQHQVASMFAVVRTGAREAALKEARRTLARLDGGAPIFNVSTMDERIDATLGDRRLNATLLQMFAVVSLVLAAFGLYATISQGVMQRQHEIAIRKAVGATNGSLYRLVLSNALKLTAAGVTLGLGLTAWLGRVILSDLTGATSYTNLLHGVNPGSSLALGLPSIAMLLVGLLAAYVPARRGARLDPIAALRE